MPTPFSTNLSTLVGLVKDKRTEAYIEGVRVVATETGTQAGSTFLSRSDGSFSIANLFSGIYTLSLTKDGYLDYTLGGIALPGGTSKTLDDIRMTSLDGAIAGKADGPAGATVQAILSSTGVSSYGVTDENGDYTVEHLFPGEYVLSVSLVGYSATPASQALSLDAGEQRTGVDFSLSQNTGLIAGKVVLAEDPNVGLKGALVTADD